MSISAVVLQLPSIAVSTPFRYSVHSSFTRQAMSISAVELQLLPITVSMQVQVYGVSLQCIEGKLNTCTHLRSIGVIIVI